MQGWFSVREEEKHQRLNLLLTVLKQWQGAGGGDGGALSWITFTPLLQFQSSPPKGAQNDPILFYLENSQNMMMKGFKGYCISGKPCLRMIFCFETCRPLPNTDKVATHYIFHLAELAMSCLCLSLLWHIKVIISAPCENWQ